MRGRGEEDGMGKALEGKLGMRGDLAIRVIRARPSLRERILRWLRKY